MESIAIMQPYIFPYIGYFQMISSVDLFVLYDDVNFMKKGWINRNKILLNRSEYVFTIPCLKISQNKKICDTKVNHDIKEFKKLFKLLEHAYKSAPNYEVVIALIEDIVYPIPEFIHELAGNSIVKISEYLEIDTTFTSSYKRYNNETLNKSDRLIDICHKEKISNYVNAIGGQELYSKKLFKDKDINLKFLKPRIKEYDQFGNEFIPGLSIIDVLMFNDKEKIKNDLLSKFDLI